MGNAIIHLLPVGVKNFSWEKLQGCDQALEVGSRKRQRNTDDSVCDLAAVECQRIIPPCFNNIGYCLLYRVALC